MHEIHIFFIITVLQKKAKNALVVYVVVSSTTIFEACYGGNKTTSVRQTETKKGSTCSQICP